MNEVTQIGTVTEEKVNRMKGKSVLALSDSPSADGVSASMLKQVFVAPLWEGDDSLIGEMRRICVEANALFKEMAEKLSSNAETTEKIKEEMASKKHLPTYEFNEETGRLTITIGQ